MANKNHSQLDAIICVSSERWSQLWLYSIRYFAIGIYWIVVTGNGKFVVQWPDFCVKANTPISLYHNFRHQIRCFRSDNDRQRNPKNKWKTNIPQPIICCVVSQPDCTFDYPCPGTIYVFVNIQPLLCWSVGLVPLIHHATCWPSTDQGLTQCDYLA